MYRSVFRALSSGALASVIALGAAQADVINDLDPVPGAGTVYWGGVVGGANTDVIGTIAGFEIFSATVTRVNVGPGTADLRVVISTNHNPSSPAAVGTGFGALFLGPVANLNLIPPAPNHPTDTYSADTDRFSHVVPIPTHPVLSPNGGGNTGLIPLIGDGTDVQRSFFPNPPDTGGGPFRAQQAVGYLGGAAEILDANWSYIAGVPNTLIFDILGENGMFGTDFVVAWAMTCANDVVLGSVHVDLPPPRDQLVPLPAGFILMGTVLFGAGGLARWRSRRARRAAA
jgi:hypothetical protein